MINPSKDRRFWILDHQEDMKITNFLEKPDNPPSNYQWGSRKLIISPGVYIEKGAFVRNSIIFNNSIIRSNSIIDKTIIDKEVEIKANCRVYSYVKEDDFQNKNISSGSTITSEIGKKITTGDEDEIEELNK
jgi:NDP-sugar pyrophosphorylase family protein